MVAPPPPERRKPWHRISNFIEAAMAKVRFKFPAFVSTDGWSRGGRDNRTFSGRRVKAGEIMEVPDEHLDKLPNTVEVLDAPAPKAAPKPKKAPEDKE